MVLRQDDDDGGAASAYIIHIVGVKKCRPRE